ncbi:helix-turn-helix domain-containing protein [Bacillota bacterium Meth-B3]
MELIARKIARENSFPKYRVRARLIQLGHVMAKGALNYVDGHLCLNDPKYVVFTSAGARLTKWANAHVDECCLRFISVYEQCGVAEYRFGTLNSDEEYNRHYLMLGDNDKGRTKPVSFAEMSDIVSSLPDTFHEALIALMKMKRMTIEQLAESASMSVDTIKRLRRAERKNYTMDQVVALCVGLHLPPWLSCELTARAGLTLRDISEHRAYRYILDCLFMDRIEDVQRFLKENKLEPLNLNSIA